VLKFTLFCVGDRCEFVGYCLWGCRSGVVCYSVLGDKCGFTWHFMWGDKCLVSGYCVFGETVV